MMARHQRYHVMLHDPSDPWKFEKMVTLKSFADERRANDFMSRLKRPQSERAVVYDSGPKKRSGESSVVTYKDIQTVKKLGGLGY